MFGFYNKKKLMGGVRSSMYYVSAPERKERPETEKAIFNMCKGTRKAKNAKNSFSREEAGTIGRIIVTKRFSNSRLTCACKTYKFN